ncbi:MAG: hypothetical protein HXY38_08135 [Chloroflexi bacterium]|nr:hypothetical protein [Chloroflexota bacterium]
MIVPIRIVDLEKPPALKFPERCVNCDKPMEETLGMTLKHMCKLCAEKERSVARATLIPFLVTGLIFGGIAFMLALFFSPEGTTPQTLTFPFVFGSFIGLIVGIIVGTIGEMIVKTLAIPFYGRLITRRLLTVVSLFSETDELMGVSARFLREKKIAQLEFENEEIAREFIQYNQLETQ